MNFGNKILSFLAIISFLIIPASFSAAQTGPMIQNGMLVHVPGDPTLYYIDNGLRRPIDSMEAFRMQGFSSSIRDVSAIDLAYFPPGDIITKTSVLRFPGEIDVVPDLAPFAARDIQLVNRDGRKLLLFTTMFWNRGRGPLELDATSMAPTAENTFETAQRVVLPDGSVRNKVVGNLFWHEIHKHFHYDDFASYVLELVPGTKLQTQTTGTLSASQVLSAPMPDMPGMEGMHSMPTALDLNTPDSWEAGLTPMSQVLGVSTLAPEIVDKSTFCIYETEFISLSTDSPKKPKKSYTGCGKYKQGISVGWADKYNYTLPDQNFDVTNLPAGIYRLAFVLDPLQQFMEVTRGNNTGVAFVELNPQAGTMRVVASGSPFASPDNFYPDGMLVRSENDPAVYVMQNNKKQLLSTPATSQVFILPQGVFDAIPRLQLIQAVGSPTIYLLNDKGYRRGITSLEVFNSYGLHFEDVSVISPLDLPKYPETDLVTRAGDNNVYSLSTRQKVGTVGSLPSGFNSASIHNINQLDFENYMVDVYATGLFVPWDMAFLPDGDMLVPERSGALRRLGKNPSVITVPAVLDTGEGGLMGLVLHPKFAENSLLYVYFTTAQNGQKNRVVRFKLVGNQLTDQTIIIDNIPSAIYHDGGRMAFGPDGMLYVTTGDANTQALAQDLNSLAGKILRLTPDGGIPADNPFGTAVWTYGHRNGQGIAWDNQGRMWETEHGPTTGAPGEQLCCRDELNLIEKGKNYGWPVIVGDETRTGMISPVLTSGAFETWAPAGLAWVNGSLYFAGLKGSTLYQVRFNPNGSVRDLQAHFKNQFGRLRAVVLATDGSLYITTSNRDGRGTARANDDKIIRVSPAFLESTR